MNNHSTQYLYSIKKQELENKFYFEALRYKLEAGKRLQKQLYLAEEDSEYNRVRLFFVEKAIRHTNKLINEED